MDPTTHADAAQQQQQQQQQQQRRPGPPSQLLQRPDAPAIIAALRAGEPLREVARRFNIAPSSCAKLRDMIEARLAEHAEQPAAPEQPPAPAYDPAACPLCRLPPHELAHADRALHDRPHDLARTAAFLKVSLAVAKRHLDHCSRPAGLDGPPAPRPEPWKPAAAPFALPDDIEAARALLAQKPAALAAITAWARREAAAFARTWPGPVAAKEALARAYRTDLARVGDAGKLLVARRYVERLTETAATDGNVASFLADTARATSAAAPATAFNAARFLGLLGQRGITFRVDERGAVVASNSASLNELDRTIIREHKTAIAAAVMDMESFQ